ncbi:hypothetical protein Tco_1339353 [Tanacetum coccineum]
MTPRAVLLKTGLTPLNIVRPVNTSHPKLAVHSAKSILHFSKLAQSTNQRPFYKKTTLTSRYVNQKLNTAMRHYHTKRHRAVNTARSYTAPVNVVRAKRFKPQQDDMGFIDSGCSRHMTGNIAYLSDFKEFDKGYVTFGGGAHGGRIYGKGTLKTDNLDFEEIQLHICQILCSQDSPFELVAYTDSDYAGATQDRKFTTGGCQFLGNRLISWQCKKQTVVATSTTEVEYVATASYCGQVLWIQNQLLDYGYNFMNTVINIDNNNLLTKGFDAGTFQYLVSSIGMLNP